MVESKTPAVDYGSELSHPKHADSKRTKEIRIEDIWKEETRCFQPPEGGIFNARDGWTPLNTDYLTHLLHLFDTDPCIMTASEINLQDIVHGNLDFDRKDHELTAECKIWTSNVWMKWIKECMRYAWSWGFIVTSCIPHRKFGWEPRVVHLPPGACIMYRITTLGAPQLAVLIPLACVKPLEYANMTLCDLKGFEDYGFLPNAHVFWRKPPLADGTIVSSVAAAGKVIADVERLRELYWKAAQERAQPAIVTEAIPSNVDSRLQADLNTVGARDPNNAMRNSSLDPSLLDDLEREYSRVKATRMTRILGGLGVDVVNQMLQSRDLGFGGGAGVNGPKRIDIPAGRKPAASKLPEGPAEMMQWQLYAQQQIFMIWTIPPSVIQAESTRGRVTSDTNAQHLLKYHREKNKKEALALVEQFYNIVWQDTLHELYVKSAPVGSDLKDRMGSKTTVTMPGIPPDDKLRELLFDGVIKPDKYVDLVAINTSLPRASLFPSPRPDIYATMMQMPDGGSSSSSSSSSSKKKPKLAQPKQSSRSTKENKEEKKFGKPRGSD
jgi:hypothetical protein